MITVQLQALLMLKSVIGSPQVSLQLDEGTTIKELIGVLVARYGYPFASIFINPVTNQPYEYFRLLLNGQDIVFLQNFETQLTDGDIFLIIPIIGGG